MTTIIKQGPNFMVPMTTKGDPINGFNATQGMIIADLDDIVDPDVEQVTRNVAVALDPLSDDFKRAFIVMFGNLSANTPFTVTVQVINPVVINELYRFSGEWEANNGQPLAISMYFTHETSSIIFTLADTFQATPNIKYKAVYGTAFFRDMKGLQ